MSSRSQELYEHRMAYGSEVCGCNALSFVALPCLALPCFTLPRITSHRFGLPDLVLSCIIVSCPPLPCPALPSPALPHYVLCRGEWHGGDAKTIIISGGLSSNSFFGKRPFREKNPDLLAAISLHAIRTPHARRLDALFAAFSLGMFLSLLLLYHSYVQETAIISAGYRPSTPTAAATSAPTTPPSAIPATPGRATPGDDSAVPPAAATADENW